MNNFSKSHRLLKKSDYDYVFSKAVKISNSSFIFLYRENTIGHARLGLALSKKNVAKAHDRNRMKRLLRETFRQRTLPAVDVVVLAKRGSAQADNATIIAKLSGLWDKL